MRNEHLVPLKDKTRYYKGKPYQAMFESRLKAEGIAKVLDGYGIVHTDTIHKDMEWIEVVIYMCLYPNSEGMIWVREKTEFYEKFKTKQDERSNFKLP